MKTTGIILLALYPLVAVNAIENGLGKAPPMGWYELREQLVLDAHFFPLYGVMNYIKYTSIITCIIGISVVSTYVLSPYLYFNISPFSFLVHTGVRGTYLEKMSTRN